MRRDGSTRDELIIYVVPAPEATNFTLYEDDGRTTAYQHGELRQTDISQQWVGQQINVEIAAAAGSFAGANTTRDNQLQLMLGAAEATAVLLDGEPLPVLPSRAAWEAAHAGWYAADGVLRAKSGPQPVADAKQFTIELVEAAPAEIESADPPPAAAPAPAAAADAERDDAETAASANSQGWLLLGISLAILLLVKVGGWLYLRRRRRS